MLILWAYSIDCCFTSCSVRSARAQFNFASGDRFAIGMSHLLSRKMDKYSVPSTDLAVSIDSIETRANIRYILGFCCYLRYNDGLL